MLLEEIVRDLSFADYLCEKWLVLCDGFGVPASEYEPTYDHIRSLLQPWGAWPIGQKPRYRSFVSGDGFPAEMSIGFSGSAPEFRILFESLGATATSQSCRRAGADLTQRMADDFGVYTASYEMVKDVFLPRDSDGGLIWHSVAWRPGSEPKYKVYLGTQPYGPERAYDVVGKAMAQLGMSSAWAATLDGMTPELRSAHELDFFALDLNDEPTARAKVYLRHHGVTVDKLDRLAGLASSHCSPIAVGAYRKIVGDQDRILTHHPLTCLAFHHDADGAVESTTYLRLTSVSSSDSMTCGILGSIVDPNILDAVRYRATMTALASGGSPGVQELVGLRTRHHELDATIYVRFDVYGRSATAPQMCPKCAPA
jgi:Tryptophan dimethylallyltransferase